MRILTISITGAALWFSFAASAQSPTPARKPTVDQAEIQKRLQQQISKNPSGESRPGSTTASGEAVSPGRTADVTNTGTFMPEAPDAMVNDVATQQLYLAAMREYYNYRISGYQHRQRVFAWQFVSSKLIFATVLLLVFAGIYFAAIQFHKGLSANKSAGESVTDIEASFKGIKVSSPVLGVIILVISFAFFYLYLVYVYPIHEVF